MTRIADALGLSALAMTESDVRSALRSQIERVNRRLEHYEQICKFLVMNEDFPTEVRSINVFQKIKVDRKVVAERYRKEIDEIYSGASEGEGY